MKKWATFTAAGVLTMGLAACGQTAEPTTETTEEQTSDMTLEEVFDKSMEVSNATESLSAKIDMTQNMKQPSQDLEMETSSVMDMDITMDPLAIYQKGTTTMKMDGSEEEQTMDMEMYMTEQGFFMNDSTTGQWMKLPSEMYDQIAQMTEQQSDPSQQLKQLETFKDDFTFEQTDSEYVLKLSAAGDEFNALIEEQMSQFMPELEGEENQAAMDEMMEAMNIEKVDYTINIDKETFETTAVDMIMDMTMEMEGEKMDMNQVMNADYSNYNGVETITVPEDVVNGAQEMQM
ncbi:DUF6612 family protein [Domibacillus enclensis]|uniref:Lipoprotein n=1 Tax=Domibacillus enclensis TaxID=1017273 RepID=A0A1N7BS65_9BACI|nr:DUF6612 family protein [Domibacillus enclensis]OXS74530.1 hypothetical protein B1B05_16700 [Domibacillus enclensis]SIR54165.1 hypothetical protein SAMN05443094_11048 [Domibacillus enclensis]